MSGNKIENSNDDIVDVTYFDLNVYKLYDCSKCVREEDIKELPFYDIWLEGATALSQ